jgi:hypothetical protein
MSELPGRPDLDQLRRQARELLRAATDGEPRARARMRAVSERRTLSAAQLAVAREYGFASWPALRTEVARRRRSGEAAARPPALVGLGRPEAADDRWSLGGAVALETAAGTLSPRALVAGPRQAALDVWLTPSPETQRRLTGRSETEGAGARVAGPLFTLVSDFSEILRFDDVVVVDDRGTTYTLAFESGSIPHESVPLDLRFRLDPVPPRECGWLELRGTDGSAARLLPSERPMVQISQPAPAAPPGPSGSPEAADMDRPEHVLSPTGQPPTGQPPTGQPVLPAEGPAHHLDIAADLPPVDGTAVRLDSLICEADDWCIYLRARPGWWTYSEDAHRKWAAMAVDAQDDLGRRYVSTFGGSTGHGDHEELVLRFQPRLDSLAVSVRLAFTGAEDQVVVDVPLAPAATSGGLPGI